MAERSNRATLSKGRSGWCMIFRHPVVLASDQKQKLRVRRGLGTRERGRGKGYWSNNSTA